MQPSIDPYQYGQPPANKPPDEGKTVPQPSHVLGVAANNPAIDVIRQKLEQLYANEPSAKEEQAEVVAITTRSKHQQYMFELANSGKSAEEIQSSWHAYYQSLPDAEKHQVWQEFYAGHQEQQSSLAPHRRNHVPTSSQIADSEKPVIHISHYTNTHHSESTQPQEMATNTRLAKTIQPLPPEQSTSDERTPTSPKHRKIQHRQSQPQLNVTVAEIREQLLSKVRSRTKGRGSQHIQSLAFGLTAGLITVAILSFGFFNERFIAPFITPSRAVSSTPLIIDPASTAVSSSPEIIIPKINVEIPVVYDVATIDEKDVQAGLERGVVHYATTPMPGQKGNGVIFGHSANNILNKGKYKFAFVLLRKLDVNDTFYLQKDGKRYVYRIYDKKIVPPTDVSVLNTQDKPATFTLITCDPPGTSLNRLVVIGEQISPDPSADTASTAQQDTSTKPQTLPSNSPTLWSRVTNWISH